jgi:hypothetical protein
MYVLKFRGAGQGPKVLIAELIAGEIARIAGLPVPEIVFIELEADLGRTEPDPEIQSLIRASDGLNIGLDYLPGAVTFDPLADQLDAQRASRIVWFDAFVTNVDRTARNANLLVWHKNVQLIDHGAALYFHHSWDDYLERSTDPFKSIKDHILLPFASELDAADEFMSQAITRAHVEHIVALVPESWLKADAQFPRSQTSREAYVDYFVRRLQRPHAFVQEAIRARS